MEKILMIQNINDMIEKTSNMSLKRKRSMMESEMDLVGCFETIILKPTKISKKLLEDKCVSCLDTRDLFQCEECTQHFCNFCEDRCKCGECKNCCEKNSCIECNGTICYKKDDYTTCEDCGSNICDNCHTFEHMCINCVTNNKQNYDWWCAEFENYEHMDFVHQLCK